jgi:hypothetical protein
MSECQDDVVVGNWHGRYCTKSRANFHETLFVKKRIGTIALFWCHGGSTLVLISDDSDASGTATAQTFPGALPATGVDEI